MILVDLIVLAATTLPLVSSARPQKTLAAGYCKITPLDAAWPSKLEWSSLNASIDGVLLKTSPAASSCWPGSLFDSPLKACEEVEAGWSSTDFHAALPESVVAPYFANSSCLPPGIPGYFPERGCQVGGYPQYVVNATTEQQIATAMKWASQRNIRIVVKGTGHDMAARSAGAFALSIWTQNFRRLDFSATWSATGGIPSDALIVGCGYRWREVYEAAEKAGRAVVGGGDGSVGLGGHIQGGGHGPLSSSFGLAADQVYQVTVVTTDGRVIIANDAQYQDLLWAIRGGTGGLYGVVTEYVLKTYPAVTNVTLGAFSIAATNDDPASIDAVLAAATLLTSKIPDLMDSGLTGTVYLSTGLTSLAFNPNLTTPPPGISITYRPFAYDTTPEAMTSLLSPILQEIRALPSAPTITQTDSTAFSSFNAWFRAFGQSTAVGTGGVLTSHLLSRAALTSANLSTNLQQILTPQNAIIGSVLVLCMVAGRGPAHVPADMRGALLPAWRHTYVHAIAAGAIVDATNPAKTPEIMLKEAATWLGENLEPVWRDWSPGTGAYFNEANPFLRTWREDFYGESYEGLREVKAKYDRGGSLWVLGGVGNEEWEYDWGSGRLCRTQK